MRVPPPQSTTSLRARAPPRDRASRDRASAERAACRTRTPPRPAGSDRRVQEEQESARVRLHRARDIASTRACAAPLCARETAARGVAAARSDGGSAAQVEAVAARSGSQPARSCGGGGRAEAIRSAAEPANVGGRREAVAEQLVSGRAELERRVRRREPFASSTDAGCHHAAVSRRLESPRPDGGRTARAGTTRRTRGRGPRVVSTRDQGLPERPVAVLLPARSTASSRGARPPRVRARPRCPPRGHAAEGDHVAERVDRRPRVLRRAAAARASSTRRRERVVGDGVEGLADLEHRAERCSDDLGVESCRPSALSAFAQSMSRPHRAAGRVQPAQLAHERRGLRREPRPPGRAASDLDSRSMMVADQWTGAALECVVQLARAVGGEDTAGRRRARSCPRGS